MTGNACSLAGTVSIIHHTLEAVEALSSLYFVGEALDQNFVDNVIGGSEEGKDMESGWDGA